MANLQQLIQLGVAGKLDQKQFDALPVEIRQALAQRLVGGGQTPQLPSELKDISHLFGAGTVDQQITRGVKASVSRTTVGLFETFLGAIWGAAVLAILAMLFVALCAVLYFVH